ncbi:MAG: JAB domain-containing protein [Merismopedia sp. SIO2A8]|nr:JAB domain-containing protein [Merismopedia sp. SIO2A8]
MTYALRMVDMPTSERPRERLLEQGARNLSNAELLALLLGTGQGAGKLSAVGLGHHILKTLSAHERDPLDVLRTVSAKELMDIQGIGQAKATTILAAVELGKRVLYTQPQDKIVIDDPAIAASYLSNDLMWQPQERFAVLLLDVKHQVIGRQIVSIGTATETLAHPRDIFREAIRQGATRLIVAHNHPSGNVEPSQDDIALTQQLLSGADVLGIPVLDHLILGNGNHSSMRQLTTLWQGQ